MKFRIASCISVLSLVITLVFGEVLYAFDSPITGVYEVKTSDCLSAIPLDAVFPLRIAVNADERIVGSALHVNRPGATAYSPLDVMLVGEFSRQVLDGKTLHTVGFYKNGNTQFEFQKYLSEGQETPFKEIERVIYEAKSNQELTITRTVKGKKARTCLLIKMR